MSLFFISLSDKEVLSTKHVLGREFCWWVFDRHGILIGVLNGEQYVNQSLHIKAPKYVIYM